MHDRIVSNPQILGGKPCVKGTRIPVYMILELVEAGIPFDEIRAKFYPQLAGEDIKACIAYARQIVQNEEVHLVLEQTAGESLSTSAFGKSRVTLSANSDMI